MVIVGVLAAVMVFVGALVWWVHRSAARHDPVDVRVSRAQVHDAVVKHPRLARALRRRLDPKALTGLFLTAAAATALLGTFVVGVVLRMVQTRDGLARLDDWAARFGVHHLSPATRQLLRIVTQLGSTRVVVPLALAVVGIERRRMPSRRVFWFFLVAFGGTVAITNVVKALVDRARPDIARLVVFSGPAFPSGHSSSAAATYAALALVLGRGRRGRTKAALGSVAAMVAVAVATSRVLLGVHWLTDVIAGLALGSGWFAISSIMFGGRLLEFGRPVRQLEDEAVNAPDPRIPS